MGSNLLYCYSPNLNTLSTGWTGTCPLADYYNNFYQNYTSELTSLSSAISSTHSSLLSSYSTTNTLINNLYTVNYLISTRPSGSTGSLMPKSEYEFSDRTNTSLIGGEIYYDFINKLKANIESLNGTIRTSINNFVSNDNYKQYVDSAYQNFIKFDTAVATASNVMNNNMLDLRDYFLT